MVVHVKKSLDYFLLSLFRTLLNLICFVLIRMFLRNLCQRLYFFPKLENYLLVSFFGLDTVGV